MYCIYTRIHRFLPLFFKFKTDDLMQATSAQTLRATRTYDREEFA